MTVVTIPNRPAGTDVRSIEQILANFDAITGVINGGLDNTNIADSLGLSAGVNTPDQVVKGVSDVPASQSTTSTTYTLMPTPDQVQNLVLPSDGLILVTFKALWGVTGPQLGYACIFLNNNPTVVGGQGAPVNAETNSLGSVNTGHLVTDSVKGLVGMSNTGTASSDVTTGQLLAASSSGAGSGSNLPPGGGIAVFEAAAGNYNVSVRFKVGSGATVTVSNRRLRAWVWSPS